MPGVEIARARILNLKHISKPVRTYSIRQERHQTEAARSAHIPFRPSGKGSWKCSELSRRYTANKLPGTKIKIPCVNSSNEGRHRS